ncbi:MAG: hypothetical protein WCT50_03230 [Patescibacteria group bacterium]
MMVALFGACNYVEFEELAVPEAVVEAESQMVLKSATGFSSTVGTVYVQKDVVNGLKVENKAGLQVTSAKWKIESSTYDGTQIFHKFNALGEIALTIDVVYADATKETRTFKVQSVVDMSTADPVRVFTTANTDGTWNVLFLFSKERVKYATSTEFAYNGNVTAWVQKAVPTTDRNYIIGVDGKPITTTDVGKYIGVKIILKEKGVYNICLIHSGKDWTNLSGSKFIRSDNSGLCWFSFDSGVVVANGEILIGSVLPGFAGDGYFRFSLPETPRGGVELPCQLYFKLDGNYTAVSFVVRELEGGGYSAPITMNAVPTYADWGTIEIPVADLIGSVNGFRYGPDKTKPTVYAAAMPNSFFYSTYFNKLQFSLIKV